MVEQIFIQSFGLLNNVSNVRSGREKSLNILFCSCKSNSEQNVPTQISSLPVLKLNGARLRTNSTQVCCQLRTHNNPRLSRRRRKAEPQAAAAAHVHSSVTFLSNTSLTHTVVGCRAAEAACLCDFGMGTGQLLWQGGEHLGVQRSNTKSPLCWEAAVTLNIFYICKCQYTYINR